MSKNEYSDEFLKRAINPKQVEAFMSELSKNDRFGRQGVEFELHNLTNSLLPLLQKVQDIVSQDLNKYWQMINFLSTKDFFVAPVQQHKTEGVFNLLVLLPQAKADFILGKIIDITSEQLHGLQVNLLKKDKYGFIQDLRRTKYESIVNQCWAIGFFVGVQHFMNQEEGERKEVLSLLFKEGLIPNVEVCITDAFYNRIVDFYQYFMRRYEMDKRACDGALANVFLALALSFNYESLDYFLVLMHTIGIRVYDCVVWLFLEIKDWLSAEDYDAIYPVLQDANPKEYNFLLHDYVVCDTQEELNVYKKRYGDLLDVKSLNKVYSYFSEEDLSGEYKMYRLPIKQDFSSYQLDFLGIMRQLVLDSIISSSKAIPRDELFEAQKGKENALPENNSSDTLSPVKSQTNEQQPQREPSNNCDQTIPDALSKEHEQTIKNFKIGECYFSEKQTIKDYKLPHCEIVNKKLNKTDLEKRAKFLESLIKLLARYRCIYPSLEVMRSCAYAFTGIGFKSPFKPVAVYWNSEKVDILLFICQKFYNNGGKTAMTNFQTAVDVFHVREKFVQYSNPSAQASEVGETEFGKKFKEIYDSLFM